MFLCVHVVAIPPASTISGLGAVSGDTMATRPGKRSNGGTKAAKPGKRSDGGTEAAKPGKRKDGGGDSGGDQEGVERRLEELLFGGEVELLERLQEEKGGRTLLDDDSSDSEVENEAKSGFHPAKKAAWEDEEDEADQTVDMTHRFRKNFQKSSTEKTLSMGQLQRRLKEQFQTAMGGTPSWAESKDKKKRKNKEDSDDESDEDADLLRKTGNFVSRSDALPKGLLEIKNYKSANCTRPSDAKLTTTQFHPGAQVILTAGIDQSISLFQVDGKTNPKIQSIYLERFPVYKARFSADGEQVIATGVRHKMFYIYDMMVGKLIPVHGVRGLEEKQVKKFEVSPDGLFLLIIGTSGYLHLLSMKTKEFVGCMKINGEAISATFSPDGNMIYTNSDEGEVYIWDVKSRKCLTRFDDEGCLKGTCIAVSRNGQYLACGSSSGIVNVYSRDACLHQTNPKPVKAIRNLVTTATSLVFNPTTEILAIASKTTDDAVKMIHIPSFTAFSNFPAIGQKFIHLAQEMDFSPRSGFFSIATNRGHALLYRVKHYADF